MSDSQTWPIYFKDRLTISNLESSVAIACLWTPKEAIERLVPKENYSVLGQLYTKKGINYLLRNVLANPFINTIYLCGNDLMESGEAFVKFMRDGITEDYKVVGDDSAEIEIEISLEAINKFRANVKLIDLRGPDKLAVLKTAIEMSKFEKLWADPETFDDPPKPQVSTYPSEIDLIKIRRTTIAEAYLSILKHVSMFGLESEPVINYVSDTSSKLKEVLNLTAVITEENPDKWNIPEYMPFNQADLDNYIKGFFDPDPHTEDYTYGERLFNYAHSEIKELKEIYPWLKIDRFQKYFNKGGGIDQVSVAIIRKLKKFPYDKGAMAFLGNTFTDIFPQRPSKKIPCLFLIQCQIYQGKLTMTCYFRSNDMYNAWPLNAFALRKLQSDIAKELEVKMGALVTISNMAHVYEHNFSDMEKLLTNYGGYCEWDPRGNLIVETIEDMIHVKLISPDGNLELKSWEIDGKEQNAARKLSFMVDTDLAISSLGNALYMGRQFERAETAVKLHLEFRQDNPLDFSKIKK
jgi:thymidylate synthase